MSTCTWRLDYDTSIENTDLYLIFLLFIGAWDYMYTKPVSKEEYKFCTVWEILGGAYGVPGSPCNSHAIGNEYSEIYIYMYIITSQRTRWFCNLLNILPIFFINCDQNVECDWPAGNRLITASLKTCYLYSKLFPFFFCFSFSFSFFICTFIYLSVKILYKIFWWQLR